MFSLRSIQRSILVSDCLFNMFVFCLIKNDNCDLVHIKYRGTMVDHSIDVLTWRTLYSEPLQHHVKTHELANYVLSVTFCK